MSISVSEDHIKLRCKVYADNPNDAWQLECDVREQMLAYLNNEKGGAFLPIERVQLVDKNT